MGGFELEAFGFGNDRSLCYSSSFSLFCLRPKAKDLVITRVVAVVDLRFFV